MNTFRFAAVCAIALLGTSAWAEDQTASQSAEPPAQDVGGVIPPSVQAGAPHSMSRQQVYQDLIQSQRSGQMQSLDNDLYRGH